jgi:transcriptional regulator PpsR
VHKFKAAKEYLGALRDDQLGALLAVSGDVVLFVGEDGLIKEFAIPDDRLATELGASKRWIGKPWAKLVTRETAPKLEALVKEVRTEPSSPRQLNHVTSGEDVPIVYTVLRIGNTSTMLALGRDMRSVARLQQQLVAAQARMDAEYEKLRSAQMRYKFLFEITPDPVLIVDAGSLDVLDANPAARRMLGEAVKRGLMHAFSKDGANAVRALLDQARSSTRSEAGITRLAGQSKDVAVAVSHIKHQGGTCYLVRVSAKTGAQGALSPAQKAMLACVERSPDGFVLIDEDGLVAGANAAFLEMINLGSEEGVKGQSIEQWVGRAGVDVGVILSNLRERGTIRLYTTTLRTELSDVMDVELSGVSVMGEGRSVYGLSVRQVSQRVAKAPQPQRHRTPEEIKQLIGRMSLKDLVRETADVIERMGIEAALDLTKDNRASAAELLGLSRQSLYIKLRRYGLDNDATDNTG